jgi:hypothetical protein
MQKVGTLRIENKPCLSAFFNHRVYQCLDFWFRYKTATILISFVSVVIIVSQAIYNSYFDQRWKEVDYLTSQLERKKEELLKRNAIPKVRLSVNTLERAGLSRQALKLLTAIPSTVEIKHVSGGTAKGLQLDINLSEPILHFQKWQSNEDFVVKKIGENNMILRIEAAQLRKDAVIGLTVLTRELPYIEPKLLIDTGELDLGSSNGVYLTWGSPIVSGLSVHSSQVPVTDFTEDKTPIENLPLEQQIPALEARIETLRVQSFSTWLNDQVGVLALVLLLVPLGLTIPASIVISRYRKDQRKKLSRDNTAEAIKSGKFEPSTPAHILMHLGLPDYVYENRKAEGIELEMVYFSKYLLLSDTGGISFCFIKDELSDIEDEEGNTLLEQAKVKV